MTKLVTIVMVILGLFTVGITAAWSRFQVRSYAPLLHNGEHLGPFVAGTFIDVVNPELCILVLVNADTGQFAMETVPRISCDLGVVAQ